ncbi:MAG: hypothetical protein R3311_13035, partial [Oceanisphaera sp.]|nr:hypothetical protein [Oceanisphaera sp.]
MSNKPMNTLTIDEMMERVKQSLQTGVGKSVPHDSAAMQVAGEAQYIDDRLEFPNQLHLYARLSERAHARITKL